MTWFQPHRFGLKIGGMKTQSQHQYTPIREGYNIKCISHNFLFFGFFLPVWVLEPLGSNTISRYLLSRLLPAISGQLLPTPVHSCQLPSTPGNSGRSFIHFLVCYILDLYYVIQCFPTFSDVFPIISFFGLLCHPVPPTWTL